MSVDGYLARLGLDHRPPATLETLVDLQRRHLDTLPYDNLAIMLGRPDPVDPDVTLARIAAGGNAGYCFHHNAAFEAVLRSLGYRTSRRGGAVVDAQGVSGPVDHHVVVVHDLPAPGNPDGRWWADVGFGDGFRDPLPLTPGTYEQGPFTYGIEAGPDDRWTFRQDPSGSFEANTASAEPLTSEFIEVVHARLSTPPEGHYTRILVVERRTADAIEALRCCTFRRITAAGREEHELREYADWRAALVGLRVSLAGVGDDELRGLHARMLGAHEEWLLARG